MADLLSFKDFAGALNRLRHSLKYYNSGEEQELDDVINTVSKLGDELMIMRDWTCLANEFRKGEHKPHRTKRLGEYVKVMIEENNRPQEKRKPFAKLRNASISTNLLVATASKTQEIKGFSETLVKYIINHGDTFIQARQLGPDFIYLPYCQILCLNEKHSESIEIWGEQKLSEFKTQCVEGGAIVKKKTKKRKHESNDATTELQTAEGSVVAGPSWLPLPRQANIYEVHINSIKELVNKQPSLIHPAIDLTAPVFGGDCYVMLCVKGEAGNYLIRQPESRITFKCEAHQTV